MDGWALACSANAALGAKLRVSSCHASSFASVMVVPCSDDVNGVNREMRFQLLMALKPRVVFIGPECQQRPSLMAGALLAGGSGGMPPVTPRLAQRTGR